MIITLSKFPAFSPFSSKAFPRFEFHVHAALRRRYEMDEPLFQSSGNVILPNYRAVRELAQKINARRSSDQAISAGQLNAMGLIDEIFHYVIRLYEETANRGVFARALTMLGNSVGSTARDGLLLGFTEEFPPLDVYRGNQSSEVYLAGVTGAKPHLEVTLEETILLHFANFNPASRKFRELFDDRYLKEHTAYTSAIDRTETFFRGEKPFGPMNQPLFDLLRAPILASPDSLEGQLDFIRRQWGLILGERFSRRLLGAHDLLVEDLRFVSLGGAAPTPVPTYRYGDMTDLDYERFTSDLEWMPKVVVIAKNTYVWLDQLSKKYKRPIAKLNEIPDEELDQLARWNFTGLWLIGIWERSAASSKIKQWTGNPEAVSSAYSVFEYEIAADLGGEEAFSNLSHRAWVRGIRLAGDMVPNHMGIYSKWVIENPEFFVQTSYKPYPNYQFTGGNLSDDPHVDIRIEDGYWSRRDAAIVFQRTDTSTGDVRYIYHGNDGTSMPWNDTAQLDFLKQEVREAVIQTILHVARKFSIIRFDAAMVLAKRHFQRLWYPQPGTGGAIPSRTDFGLTKEEFDRVFPEEFWRQVVDRINTEMPNTLLMAEAFWLLEGYFVRTLGMHRVYNSAFMNMLKMEENAKYRELIRTTLHYNPEILKRYVNFMSNPDELTAIEQFGKDDKYFGVAVLMVTLPGLPMFAHGQIEGYTEKYGMEYRRAYYNEMPDARLIARHEREIFPLTQRRHLFSQVTNFEMYDFVTTDGHVNENVFAYSNRFGDERALVCFHNRYEETSGWIRHSVGKTASGRESTDGVLTYQTLGTALGLNGADRIFYVFKDCRTNLEYLRSGRELHEQGLFVALKAFQYHVFLDFREIFDETGQWHQLEQYLDGRGVPDAWQAMQDMRFAPITDALHSLINDETLDEFVECCSSSLAPTAVEKCISRLVDLHSSFFHQIAVMVQKDIDVFKTADDFRSGLLRVKKLCKSFEKSQTIDEDPLSRIVAELDNRRNALLLFSWLAVHRLADVEKTSGVFKTLNIERMFHRLFSELGFVSNENRLLGFLMFHERLFSVADEASFTTDLRQMLDLQNVQEIIHLHEYDGARYFNKELFEELVDWLFVVSAIIREDREESVKIDRKSLDRLQRLKTVAAKVGYRYEEFVAAILSKKTAVQIRS